MEVKLIRNIPVGNEHALTKGKILVVAKHVPHDGTRGSEKIWVRGATGVLVLLKKGEYDMFERATPTEEE